MKAVQLFDITGSSLEGSRYKAIKAFGITMLATALAADARSALELQVADSVTFADATLETTDAGTDTVINTLKVSHKSSGTPAAGIGVGIEFEAETAAANDEIGAIIEAVTTDVTSTSEDFDLVFKTMAAGAAAAERFRILSTGYINITDTKGLSWGSGTSFVGGSTAESYVRIVANNQEAVRVKTGRIVGIGTNAPARTLDLNLLGSATNTVGLTLRVGHETSGTPAAGIGVGIEFEQETAADNHEIGAIIEAVTTDVTSTAEIFDLVFKTMSAGAAAAERFRIKPKGIQVIQDVTNVSDPPTDAELDAIFGEPSAIGAGFIATIDDNSADTDVWLVYTSDTSWFHLQGTKAV